MATMDERIKEHLKHLQRYQLHLKDSQKIQQEQFINAIVTFLRKRDAD